MPFLGTCTIVKNGQNVTFGRAIRKECRMLTEEERNRLVKNKQLIKNKKYNKYLLYIA